VIANLPRNFRAETLDGRLAKFKMPKQVIIVDAAQRHRQGAEEYFARHLCGDLQEVTVIRRPGERRDDMAG
jgi:hypothetical protein